MKDDFFQSRLYVEGAVPDASLTIIESASLWARVCEGCIDDPKVRDSKNQLINADACKATEFSEQSLVCSVVQLEEFT
jgi:hypothetical protein